MGREISLIWAMDKMGLIGKENQMPWHLPGELAYFRKVTTGHPIIMGRKTFESIGSKPLPNRTNVIMTRDRQFTAPGCVVLHSVEEALAHVADEPCFVIGGAQIYRAFLPLADKLYVTHIDHAFEGDEYFPEVAWSDWQLISEEPGKTDERNPYRFSFRIYVRKTGTREG